ncbi:MAG: helix-turn-helix domain-containing protein [Lentimicrobium sp.]|nr:helix-turn-helix domain-containing protein [Lentimicrobium sp.]
MTDQTFLFQMPIDEFKDFLNSAIEEVVNKTLAAVKQPEPEYLTIDQLRDYLPQNPAKQTVYQWVHFKQVPYHKRGKSVLFKRSEIDQWISETRRTTSAEAERRVNNG